MLSLWRDAKDPWRVVWMRCLLPATWLALVAVTWPLWTPPELFPSVPVIALPVPPPLQWALLVGHLLALGTALLTASFARWNRLALAAAVATWLGLVLLDQNRVQAWAYACALTAGCLVAAPGGRALPPIRGILLGIYFFSAVSKLDYAFTQTLGPQFLAGLLGWTGLEPSAWNPTLKVWATLPLPLVEGAAAGLLAVPVAWRTVRWIGVVTAAGMHLALLAALSPWGLDHSLGVLLWNAASLVQLGVLFVPAPPSEAEAQPTELPDEERGADNGDFVAGSLAVGSWIVAVAGWWGLADPWPAWALYSAREGFVRLEIRGAEHAVPPSLREHVGPPNELGYRRVRLGDWWLDRLGAPLNPARRVRYAAAVAAIESLGPDFESRIILAGASDRFDGSRAERVVDGPWRIAKLADTFWLPAEPRGPPPKPGSGKTAPP